MRFFNQNVPNNQSKLNYTNLMFINNGSDMFAVIGMGLYSNVDPEHFGNLGIALFTLFQILTLDDWYFIYTDVAKEDPG